LGKISDITSGSVDLFFYHFLPSGGGFPFALAFSLCVISYITRSHFTPGPVIIHKQFLSRLVSSAAAFMPIDGTVLTENGWFLAGLSIAS
jgi:hypothetical protein